MSENILNFFQEFLKVFPPQKPTILPLLQEVNYTITLLDTKIDNHLRIFTVYNKYIPKYEEAITKWKVAGIIYLSASHNLVNMFSKLKPKY
jgi:hypothetical protein